MSFSDSHSGRFDGISMRKSSKMLFKSSSSLSPNLESHYDERVPLFELAEYEARIVALHVPEKHDVHTRDLAILTPIEV